MKLTNTMKERIIKSIMKETFAEREKAVDAEKTKLADAVYAGFYGRYQKQMQALPESFFLQRSTVKLNVGGSAREIRMSTTRRVGKLHEYNCFDLDQSSHFITSYKEIEAKARTIENDRAALESTFKAVILPITTDKRLVEVWPDAEKYIPRTPAAMSNLPAIRPEDLNSMIQKMKGKVKA
jgi:hypothetical protein